MIFYPFASAKKYTCIAVDDSTGSKISVWFRHHHTQILQCCDLKKRREMIMFCTSRALPKLEKYKVMSFCAWSLASKLLCIYSDAPVVSKINVLTAIARALCGCSLHCPTCGRLRLFDAVCGVLLGSHFRCLQCSDRLPSNLFIPTFELYTRNMRKI